MNARKLSRLLACAALAAIACVSSLGPLAHAADAIAAAPPLPARLSETGLYVAGSSTEVRATNIEFAPQYPLWSDGAIKRRWIQLPPGTAIDASQPDAWQFPRGTRLWKEFSMGRRVETRLIERLDDGSWRFASYVWDEDDGDAQLAPADGIDVAVAAAPRGRYSVPSRTDCLACHEGTTVPVLGFTSLQLSADRDPLAPHADVARGEPVDLRSLAARGLLRNLPPALLDRPPRIDAATPRARAALGYLHGNCGHCHNDVGPLKDLDLALAQRTESGDAGVTRVLHSVLDHASRYRARGSDAARRIVAGQPDASILMLRMQSTDPSARMPPLGVQRLDSDAITLIRQWIRADVHPPQEP
jgi:hypothetical protein